ncbi:cupin fold metalloprotein, WbuC family [Pectobacterium punjabense]|uniref:Cupin fold metalloprotein, WbuC family n=1 Tax=Pectobacterium punjabense TaxID=2108399 RepID=A0ABX6L0X9_9GAMM|nr:WbuC family cupin fold metalloprotein [Pectobacterium punjabense]MBS4432308.1 WbuC family cupin fold metalloprotein [Pectobacterium punjabense]MBT9184857.1 WbuC family cupin fold metalloprotein [Pectobacterium punjabense]PTA63574.1 cupin fold metalloprotein, WbuC family [Pectobacterium punjabense]QJA19731.1 cupin fold metalloprotein, WbuC family [Pectobacterium punjabense]
MKVYNNEYLSPLFESAKESLIKRSHLNLHANYDEKVQRLFIALTKGSYVRPHYHALPHQWEMFIVIEGCVEICIYDNEGGVIKKFNVGENTNSAVVELNPYDIHSLECISDKALILEVKEGPFLIEYAKTYPSWSHD